MKVLVSTLHFGALRNFEPVLRGLAAAGHQVHLVADRLDTLGGSKTIDAITRDHPGSLTHDLIPTRKDRPWYIFGQGVRGGLDYLRYLDTRYGDAPKLTARAARYAPLPIRAIGRLPTGPRRVVSRTASALLRNAERAIPVRPDVVELLAREKPDVVLITPLLYFGTQQVDFVRAARMAGIPSALCVGSWDHLTTKGLIHDLPDVVIVWNEAQRDEAFALHGIPRERVIVTGAQAFDHWFSRAPLVSRDEFLGRVGLPTGRAMLLYLCSSPFIAPQEVAFVRRWVAALRASASAAVRDVGILIRPHPQNADQWKSVEFRDDGAVAIWPRTGANPLEEHSRADFFHSMFYSRGVVGVNTSAQIESAILGKPVLTVLSSEFAETQDGTLHFQHLKTVNGGLLRVAASLEEHVGQVTTILEGPDGPDPKAEAFVGAFVRPHGRDVAATPLFVQAVERLGQSERRLGQAGDRRAAVAACRAVLFPVAVALQVAVEGGRAFEEGGVAGATHGARNRLGGAGSRLMQVIAARAERLTKRTGRVVAVAGKRQRLIVHRVTKIGKIAVAKLTGRSLPGAGIGPGDRAA